MQKSNLRHGFTMIEVMLVLVIMVSMAAMGIVAATNYQNRAYRGLAETQIQDFSKHVEMYNLLVGNYPASDEGLEALHTCPSSISNPDKWSQLVKSVPVDPWNNAYQYQYPGSQGGDSFDIWSCGPDKISGTDDDITNWKK